MNPIMKPRQVMSSSFDNEEVLLDLDQGVYFSLNTVGKEIWDLITKGRDFDDIVTTIQNRYQVAYSTVCHDVRRLIDELVTQGLVEESSQQDPA